MPQHQMIYIVLVIRDPLYNMCSYENVLVLLGLTDVTEESRKRSEQDPGDERFHGHTRYVCKLNPLSLPRYCVLSIPYCLRADER